MISMLLNAQNPDVMLHQILGNNPMFQQVLKNIQGKNPEEIKQYAMNVCKTRGIDVESLAKQYNIPLN